MAVVAITVVFGLAALGIAYRVQDKPAVYIEGRRETASLDDKGNRSRWYLWQDAANNALIAWRKVTPSVDIPKDGFKLIADANGCGPEAIACADAKNGIIYIASDGNSVDRLTIMMHEIGHLIGVPHIEGDPLMDKAYHGETLTAPSASAVKLAPLKVVIEFSDSPMTRK